MLPGAMGNEDQSSERRRREEKVHSRVPKSVFFLSPAFLHSTHNLTLHVSPFLHRALPPFIPTVDVEGFKEGQWDG